MHVEVFQMALVKYEWDFNGDGTYDATTTTPTVAHVFSAPAQGVLGVRVTDDKDQTSSASTPFIALPPIPDAGAFCPGINAPGLSDGDRSALANACFNLTLPTQDKPGVHVLPAVPETPVTPSPSPSPSPSASAKPTPSASPTPTRPPTKPGLPGTGADLESSPAGPVVLLLLAVGTPTVAHRRTR